MATQSPSTSPEIFMPLLRDYLMARMGLVKARVRIDMEPDGEIKSSDGNTVALFLSNPRPYMAEQGAGRWTYQVVRELRVKYSAFSTGDHGTDRIRLLSALWRMETELLNALTLMKYREFGWNKPPEFVAPGPVSHAKVTAGQASAELSFTITYTTAIEQENPAV